MVSGSPSCPHHCVLTYLIELSRPDEKTAEIPNTSIDIIIINVVINTYIDFYVIEVPFLNAFVNGISMAERYFMWQIEYSMCKYS